MFDPRSGDMTTIEQIQGAVTSVTTANPEDRSVMQEYGYVVVTDEPTVSDLIERAALNEGLYIAHATTSRKEAIGQPRARLLGRRRVWMECLNKRPD